MRAPATPPVLQALGLQCSLGARRAVDGVDIALTAGSFTALVGRNGAGKSTLLALLAGLRKPDDGSVQLQGRALADWPSRDRARQIAWLSQRGPTADADAIDGDLAVRDVVALGRLPHHGLLGAPDAADAAAVEQAMRQTACDDLAHRRLNRLSGGERQRVLLARALAVGAPLLLLDEPTTHLDAPHQLALLHGLLRHARGGGTVLAVLHDLNLALAADRVLVMDRGRLVAGGAPGDAQLHDALVRVFDHAFTIEPIHRPGAAARWVSLPAIDAP